MKISAAIICLNEEKKIEKALQSLAPVVDEIVVVDSGSTDKTEQIVRKYTDRFFFQPFAGYAAQKNIAAGHATHDWILSLDSDEWLSPELQQSIKSLKETPPSAKAFIVARRNRYLGRWINHSGWYPDSRIRLYDRKHASFQGDDPHDAVVCQGATARLAGDLMHDSISSLAEHTQVMNKYTTLGAGELAKRNRKAGLVHIVLYPLLTFFKAFVIRQGFRDGWRGYVISVFAAYYVFLKHAKLWETEEVKEDAKSPVATVEPKPITEKASAKS